jgi:plastocyanin
MTHRALAALAAAAIAVPVFADTTLLEPNVYLVDEGVAFMLNNSGASSFLFNWTDDSGAFVDIADPTLHLVVGQTYTFARLTGSHPFIITNDTLEVTGTHGSHARTSTDGAVLDAATLTPIADFTADPAPTSDFIEWTPGAGDVGTYYYTCRVTFHTGMTGRIDVAPAPPACPWDAVPEDGDGSVGLGDLNGLLSNWGSCPAPCVFDFAPEGGDGNVGLGDLNALLSNWGPCP